ncbi:MAG TPA: histidinol phosphate phosphatase domain-containing protein [Dissulfurispiraceae bacterium]|nr:histidinol phosphate phosphatase domain-containing protein [Dissulfurispiraceae bacterium]
MIDLHTHSIFSDGDLIPAELIRRAVAKGYSALAITDHVDHSNIDLVVPRIVKAIELMRDHLPIPVLAGAEITHVPPALIPGIIKEARGLGAQIVVVHGETIVEPVSEGTNRAAIEGGADILAHPGIISHEDLLLAADTGITLEITVRKGHSLANGYVARHAMETGVLLTINTDAHSPSDLITKDFAERVLLSAGIEKGAVDRIFHQARALVEKALAQR